MWKSINMHINPEHKSLFYKAATTTVLAAGSLYTPWETTRIIGSTILTGIGYGVTNERISSWGCSKHFNKDHISDPSHLRNQPIQDLHSSLNAVVSGMFDYWRVSSISGIILATAARAPLSIFKVKIKATQITPYSVIGSILVTLVVQIGARVFKKYSKAACNFQHAASHGILVTGNMLLTAAILTTRIGFKLIK